jgi:hypothetical protein
MLRLLLALAIMAFFPAHAQTLRAQSEDGKDVMLLHTENCPAHVMQKHGVPPHVQLHLANLKMRDGKQFVGCWISLMGHIVTIWDDGDVIQMAPSAFQPVSTHGTPRRGRLDA